jgi:hypothetical protein
MEGSAMRNVLFIVLVLVVAVGVLGYWEGWYSLTKEGHVDVQVNPTKFNQDKEEFSKTAGEQARAMKAKIAGLWEKTEGLTSEDKAKEQKELSELQKKHDRLLEQLKELENAGQDKFESIKQDLSKSLAEVEKKIEDLTKKLEKGKDK